MARKSKLLAHPDEPLGRIVLIPLDSVAVVHWELVVEVVVTFANGDECSRKVVPGGMLIVEGSSSEPVGERVNAECGL